MMTSASEPVMRTQSPPAQRAYFPQRGPVAVAEFRSRADLLVTDRPAGPSLQLFSELAEDKRVALLIQIVPAEQPVDKRCGWHGARRIVSEYFPEIDKQADADIGGIRDHEAVEKRAVRPVDDPLEMRPGYRVKRVLQIRSGPVAAVFPDRRKPSPGACQPRSAAPPGRRRQADRQPFSRRLSTVAPLPPGCCRNGKAPKMPHCFLRSRECHQGISSSLTIFTPVGGGSYLKQSIVAANNRNNIHPEYKKNPVLCTLQHAGVCGVYLLNIMLIVGVLSATLWL